MFDLSKSREAPGTNRNTQSTPCVYLCLCVSVCVRSGPQLEHVQSHNLHAAVPSCFPLSTSYGSPPPRHPATADRVWQQTDQMEKNDIPRKKWRKRERMRERESSPWMLCLEFICTPRAVFRKDYHNKVISGIVRLWCLFQKSAQGAPCARNVCVRVVRFALLLYLEMNWSLCFESVCVATPLWRKEQHPFPVLFAIIIAEQWSALQASHY